MDDASTDGSYEILADMSRSDKRIKLIKMRENVGTSAARNEAMRNAQGSVFAYLDCDDEYYPEYLGLVDHFMENADVAVFGYDYVIDGGSSTFYYDPVPHRKFLFNSNVSTPIGVAHRRCLYERLGGFDEELWCTEDWEFWKRLARSGAEFIYLSLRSGLYHIHEGSRSRAPRTTEKQRATFEARRGRGSTLYGSRQGEHDQEHEKRVLLVAPLSCLDPRSRGADFSSNLLEALTHHGFSCRTFCGSRSETGGDMDPGLLLTRLNIPHTTVNAIHGRHAGQLVHALHGRVPITILRSEPTRSGFPRINDVLTFLSFYNITIEYFNPHVILTYGIDQSNDPANLGKLTIDLARRRDIPVVFGVFENRLGNLLDKIENIDYILCNYNFTREYFWDEFGIDCCVLPPTSRRLKSPPTNPCERRFATVIMGEESTSFSMKIVDKLTSSRPDIPLLLIEEGGKRLRLNQGGLPSFEEPLGLSDVLSRTKILLAPYAGDDPPSPIVAEAARCGIPVVARNRGPLLEILGSGGILLEVPDQCTTNTPPQPGPGDVACWLDAVVQLWGDSEYYNNISEKSCLHAMRWRSDNTGRIYSDFFRNVRPQPGPPLIPGIVTGTPKNF